MMTYLRLLLAHLPAFALGLALVELLYPRRGARHLALKLALAPGLGWGASSALYFFWSLAFTPFSAGYAWLEGGLALALLGWAAWRGWRGAGSCLAWRRPAAAALAAGGVFALGALLLWLRADLQPNGNFDAYATWNLRARFLFLSGAQEWKTAFAPELAWWVHADYPLLWPLTLLRAYLSQQRVLTQAGVLQALIFAWSLLGLALAGMARLRGGWQAALSGLALIGMPWMLNYSAFQQADVPLVFYTLACLVLLLLAQREPAGGLYALAGLAAGCAAWTKNDGAVILLAACAALLACAPRRRNLAAFGLGLVLPLAALLVFKAALAPPGDLLGAQSAAQAAAKLLDPLRYAAIAAALLRLLPGVGGLPWPALAAGLLYLLLAGRDPRQPGLSVLLLPGLTLLGYSVVYLITPQPLEWHLNYSLDRLVFHAFVPALFVWLSLARTPEDLWAALTGRA